MAVDNPNDVVRTHKVGQHHVGKLTHFGTTDNYKLEIFGPGNDTGTYIELWTKESMADLKKLLEEAKC